MFQSVSDLFNEKDKLPDLLPLKRELSKERFRNYQQGKPYTLEICPTYKCQLRCDYCYASDELCTWHEDMDWIKLKELLKESASLGVKEVGWLGGEPLLYDKFWDIAERVVGLGMVNNLRTNGIGLKNFSEEQLGLFHLIRIHLDTFSKENYSNITKGSEENFQQVFKAIEKLRKANVILHIGTVVSSLNINYIYDFIDLVIQEWKIPLMLMRFRASRSAKKKKRLEVSDKEMESVLMYYYHKMGLSYRGLPPNICARSSLYCMTELFVDYDFKIQPCDMITSPSWFYHSGNLRYIYSKHSNYFRFDNWKADDKEFCGNCEYNQICFSCRASAEVYGDGIASEDPSCIRVK